MLESQLLNEQFRRNQLESVNEGLRSQMIEIQKHQSSGEVPTPPDGFTLIEIDYLDQLIAERDHISVQRQRSSQEKTLSKFHKKSPPNKRQMLPRVDKTKSEIVQTRGLHRREAVGEKGSRSHCRFPSAERPLLSPRKVPYVEKNIGDTCDNIPERAERCDEDILKLFMKKRTGPSPSLMNLECLDASIGDHNSH